MKRNDEQLEKLKWCFKKHDKVKLVSPSKNLAVAYSKKAESAIKSMVVNADADLYDWFLSARYYAMYFEVYALFSKLGIKSEIHDCTIKIFEYLFAEDIGNDKILEFKMAKDTRIEAQYYTSALRIDTKNVILQTRNFVLAVEELIDKTGQDRIELIRKKLARAEL